MADVIKTIADLTALLSGSLADSDVVYIGRIGTLTDYRITVGELKLVFAAGVGAEAAGAVSSHAGEVRPHLRETRNFALRGF